MRTLNEKEKNRLWEKLKAKWNIAPWSYWYPLRTQEYENEDWIALDSELFEKEFETEKLNKILKNNGKNEIIRLSEEGDVYIVYDVDIIKSNREHLDYYWCTLDLDWVIYTTHEGSITFAGTWLVEKIKENYSLWKSILWG